jgi:hypothetical protein
MTYTEDLDRAIKRAKEEILDDIETGRVPATVTRFAELHDYVDANEYGGLCEVDLGGEETMSEKLMDFGNALQRQVDLWLRAGRPDSANKCVVRIPGDVLAHYEGGAITEITFLCSGSDAGYFGAAAVRWDGGENLNVEDTDGPFWTAMQRYIAGSDEPVISWQE